MRQVYKAKNSIVKILHRAKSELYLSELSSATLRKCLFAVCNNLLGLGKLAPFTNMYLMDQMLLFLMIRKIKLH